MIEIYEPHLGLDTIALYGDLTEDFVEMRSILAERLLKTDPVNTGKWQQLDISASSAHDTYELLNVSMQLPIPELVNDLQWAVPADQPWAEDHFWERVGGAPVNPGDTHQYWPYHGASESIHLHNAIYDHNYMERFWPKNAGMRNLTHGQPGRAMGWSRLNDRPMGYRFPIGDLLDVIQLLVLEPGTRQAYLPVWFPEDTGSTEKQRVPCTIGYHFIIRDGRLHVQYNLRSCEIYRHFTNDVYLAMRLGQWVRDQFNYRELHGLQDLQPGLLTFHAVSFHGFRGDTEKIEGLR